MTLPGIGYITVITPAPFNTNAAAITRNVEPTGSGISATVKSSGSVVVTGTSTGMGIAVSPTASKNGTGIEGEVCIWLGAL
jgi:hypothetical protein